MRLALSVTICLWLLSATGSWPILARVAAAPSELVQLLEAHNGR